MPVNAADDSAEYSYNGIVLSAPPYVDPVSYPYRCLVMYSDGRTNFYYLDGVDYTTSSLGGSGWFVTFVSDGLLSRLEDGIWTEPYVPLNISVPVGSSLKWANFDVFNQDGSLYLSASEPVPVYSNITGRMVFGSEQVVDDFASFVLQIADLSDTTTSITYGYKLYSGGVEVRSVMNSDDALTGNDSYLIHSTILNLSPGTEYEVVYILYSNGNPTYITASTTFTTLASSGSGGGSDPDYSGQLNGIQQGIGEIQDSVDNVGSKVDDIHDTLTETKEEITSLPGKIASAIIDGIKSLFVPSEEDLTEIKDKYESMLSEKLGFVWQGFDLLTTFVGDLQTSLESGEAYEFNFPGVVLPMQGEEFVLVPETPVSLDNELMDILRPLVGTVVSMIAVIAFVNMAHDYVLAIVSGVSVYQFERRKE